MVEIYNGSELIAMARANATSQRQVLGDANNRANSTAGSAGRGSSVLKKPADAKENENPSAASKGKGTATAAAKPSSRKRKAETSLEEDIAAYKQDLSDNPAYDYLWDLAPDITCNQVRGKINKLIDSGIMKKVEFCKATRLSANNLSSFLSKKGPYGGSGCSAYHLAWMWFKQRQLAGLKMPDVKKRQKLEADAAAAVVVASEASESASASTGSKSASKSASQAVSTSLPDISSIHLPGEETDSVEVYDTCDEVRRKINVHLKTPGLTLAQFCRDLYAQLHAPKCKGIQTKQLSDFRGQKGPRTGAKSTVFYAAYVYFEKLRIAQGKPKTHHRLNMEDIWESRGGFERDVDHRTTFLVSAGSSPAMDQYGLLAF